MRRFDPGPRLQILNNLELPEQSPRVCRSENCSDQNAAVAKIVVTAGLVWV